MGGWRLPAPRRWFRRAMNKQLVTQNKREINQFKKDPNHEVIAEHKHRHSAWWRWY